MYLVCTHHPDKAHAFILASREGRAFEPDVSWNKLAPRPAERYGKALEKFLKAHAECGHSLDHFTIAFDQPKDHDLPKVEPVADRVHAALERAKQEVVDVSPAAYGESENAKVVSIHDVHKPRMDS